MPAARSRLAAPLITAADADARATLPKGLSDDPTSTPIVNGLHLQFGREPSREMVVSWHALQPVRSPRVLLGRP